MSRAKRRHHYKRIKANRKYYWGRRLSQRELGIAAKTAKPCGCWMCSRQRKLYGMTIQELRQMGDKDELAQR